MALATLFLVVWTGIAGIWGLIAIFLVWRGPPGEVADGAEPGEATSISIFKPVASPLGQSEYAVVERCLGSVIADADEKCQVLIGAHPPEADRLQAFVRRKGVEYPGVAVELVVAPEEAPAEDLDMHPKVRWNRTLAEHADGDWWFWSDADMFTPPGTLAALRRRFGSGGGMVTSPYVVVRVGSGDDVLDALYVNVEFYPGVLLLGRVNGLANGFGAGMLFRASDFREKVSWSALGSHLADDYVLGQSLPPVRLATTVLETTPAGGSWRNALLHYLRWQKTVRWVQPGGFFSQIVILPVIGWLLALFVLPVATALFGLSVVLALDLVVALAICARVGCRLRPGQIPVVVLWSMLRGLVWLGCWLPWPVVWRGRRWWSPRLDEGSSAHTADGGLRE